MYARDVKGKTLTFGVSGKLIRNSLIMFDRQTGSLWSHLTGAAISGPLRGTELERIAATQTTWKLWRQVHADSRLLKTDSYRDDDPYAGYYVAPDSGVIGRKHVDNRLGAKDRIIGVRLGGAVKAYSFKALGRARVLDDQVGGTPLVVVFDAASESGAVYRRSVGDRLFDFNPPATGMGLVDAQTGSTWDWLSGRSTAGPLAGANLEQIPITYSFWFGWVDFYPGTEPFR